MTAYSYVAKTTPTKWRTIRMTILQVVINSCELEIYDSFISEASKNYFFVFIAMPLGSAPSGKLLMLNPIGGNGQLHIYAFIFTMSIIGYLISFLWIIFVINETRDKKMFDFEFGDENNVNQDLEKEKNTKKVNPLKLLLNFNNVKDIVRTCFKNVIIELDFKYGSFSLQCCAITSLITLRAFSSFNLLTRYVYIDLEKVHMKVK
jgi:hypothetical protein